MKNLFLQLIAIVALLTVKSLSAGDFHYNIFVSSALQIDPQQQLHAVSMTWVYDEEITKMMVQNKEDLPALGNVIMSDLARVDYFTGIRLNDKKLKTGEAQNHKLEVIKQEGKERLKLDFTLPLRQPVSLHGNSVLALDLSDSSGSAMLYHPGSEYIILPEDLKSRCEAMVVDKNKFEHSEAVQIVTIHCQLP